MKVALLICGQARFFKNGYESIKEKIIDKFHWGYFRNNNVIY